MKSASDSRRLLLEIYRTALAGVDGRARVRDYLATRDIGRRRLVAIGKAASAMALGAFDVLGDCVDDALITTKYGHGEPRLLSRIKVIESGHPTPDAQSLAAGEALLRFIGGSETSQPFLFLLSGGASALVESLPKGLALADLARLNAWLLGSGLAIGEMNRVRKRLSHIKQGRLALALAGRPTLCLTLSDVPGDDPAVIGSGPLVFDPCAGELLPPLPLELSPLMAYALPVPAKDEVSSCAIETQILVTNADARNAAAREAHRHGLRVFAHDELLVEDVNLAAKQIAAEVQAGPPGLYVWGGEVSVPLPPQPGRGGRCQHLALLLACAFAGRDDVSALAAGTDGSDGPGEDAGALIDGDTVARGETENYDAADAIARADAGGFLEASGDLIATGPTGTNVMDLVLVLKS